MRKFVGRAVVLAGLSAAGSLGWGQETGGEVKGIAIRAIPLIKAEKAETTVAAATADKADQADKVDETEKKFDATHAEIEALAPFKDGNRGQLHTFKLDREGNIVAGLTFFQTPADHQHQADPPSKDHDAEAKKPQQPSRKNAIHVYSPDFQLVREISVEFQPTALAIDPDGNYLCGGEGNLLRLSPAGEILTSGKSPNMGSGSPEEIRAQLIESYKKQLAETRTIYEEQLKSIGEQIAKLEEKYKDSDKEMTKRDKARLEALKSQSETYEQVMQQQFSDDINEQQLEFLINSRSEITSLAATGDDVFVTTNSGQGYEIWRTNREFAEGVKVREDLRGCCGQMDIDAGDGKLMIAENCEFKVGIYDRDGQSLHSFGERATETNQGFGSCCNPMNVLCCSNGDILTAESSIGKIKRYNAQGELLEYIGKARIGGGCKHVSIGFDASRNRYYIQYQDHNKICVLAPNDEADSLNAEATAARKAAQDLLAKLDGTWVRVEGAEETKTAEAQSESSESDNEEATSGRAIVIGGSGEAISMDQFLAMQTDFGQLVIDTRNGKLTTKTRQRPTESEEESESPSIGIATQAGSFRMVPQSMNGEAAKVDMEDAGGVIGFVFEMKLVEQDQLEVQIENDFGKLKKPLRFKRDATDGASNRP